MQIFAANPGFPASPCGRDATQLWRIGPASKSKAAQPSEKGAAIMIPRLRRFATAAALLVAPVCTGSTAGAETLDLTQARCSDYVAMNESDRNQLSLWLAGYYAGGAQRPLLDMEKITAAPAALAEICAKSPQLPLVGAETRAAFIPAPAP